MSAESAHDRWGQNPPSTGGGGIGGTNPLSTGGGIGGGIGGMIPLSRGGGIGGINPLSRGGGIGGMIPESARGIGVTPASNGGGIGVITSGGGIGGRRSVPTTSGVSVVAVSVVAVSVVAASVALVVELHATDPRALRATASAVRRTSAGVVGGGDKAETGGTRRSFTLSAERQSPRRVKASAGLLAVGGRCDDAREGERAMRGWSGTRRGFLGGCAAAVLAAAGARALAGCSGSDVSVRIRRVDGSVQGGTAVVRASVVVTNHTNQAQTLPMRLTLNDASGAVLGTIEETVQIAPAELLCHCINVTVPFTSGSMSGATLNITFGAETASASLQALGGTPLQDCSYTCNY